MSDLSIPSEARERMVGILLWGWLNAHRPDMSIEHVAEQALRALLSYIDEHCPEWYGRRWLERGEMEQLRRSLTDTLDAALAPASAGGRGDDGSPAWGDGVSAYDKLARALRPA